MRFSRPGEKDEEDEGYVQQGGQYEALQAVTRDIKRNTLMRSGP